MPLIQVAFSVRDRHRARAWYERVLGYLPAGGMDIPAPEPGEPSAVGALQGVPGADTDICWAVDQQEFFQLEWFQYRHPRPAGRARRLCDIGYGLVTFFVEDFDATLSMAVAEGTPALTDPVEGAGGRSVCVQDPDGVLVEITEADPRTPTPVARPRALSVGSVARSITASVPDLERSLQFFVDTLGMRPAAGVELHEPAHEALWGLEGARRDVQALWAGDLWLELVQYRDPVGLARPADHCLNDFGILNIALGTRSPELYRETLDRVERNGYHANVEFQLTDVAANYTLDDQGFSVELLCAAESMDDSIGFLPTDPV
jgi:catechol 2,3-dioxygenase-like lactoylglutathione lyase family enzyme